MYLVKTPSFIKKTFPSLVWNKSIEDKVLYLSFDDGPHPTATTFVLTELKKHNAKATFFCIGKNVAEHPEIYQQILNENHTVGNHTQNHLHGWKTKDEEYINNVTQAQQYIHSNLFRPPYGRITPFQANLIKEKLGFTIVMWDVLSGDFDTKLSPQKCTENVLLNAANGSIIVFHDSEKAYERLQFALPKVLAFFSEKGFEFKAL